MKSFMQYTETLIKQTDLPLFECEDYLKKAVRISKDMTYNVEEVSAEHSKYRTIESSTIKELIFCNGVSDIVSVILLLLVLARSHNILNREVIKTDAFAQFYQTYCRIILG